MGFLQALFHERDSQNAPFLQVFPFAMHSPFWLPVLCTYKLSLVAANQTSDRFSRCSPSLDLERWRTPPYTFTLLCRDASAASVTGFQYPIGLLSSEGSSSPSSPHLLSYLDITHLNIQSTKSGDTTWPPLLP